jgi:hypothetical protein
LQQNHRHILLTIGLTIPGTAAFYILLVNMPGYVHRQFGLPLDQAFVMQMLAVGWMTLLIPISGAWSDRIGRRPLLLWPYLGLLLLAYPVFLAGGSPQYGEIAVVQLLFCTMLGLSLARRRRRYRSCFQPKYVQRCVYWLQPGGHDIWRLCPFIVTWLIDATGSPIAPVYYLLLSTALGVSPVISCRAVMLRLPTAGYSTESEPTLIRGGLPAGHTRFVTAIDPPAAGNVSHASPDGKHGQQFSFSSRESTCWLVALRFTLLSPWMHLNCRMPSIGGIIPALK